MVVLVRSAYCSSYDFRFFLYGFCVSLKDLLMHVFFYVNRGLIIKHLMLLFNLDFGLELFLDVWMRPF
ncbi:hypothetical protein Hanom_Chr01g00068161 [Helianthus anomalus]